MAAILETEIQEEFTTGKNDCQDDSLLITRSSSDSLRTKDFVKTISTEQKKTSSVDKKSYSISLDLMQDGSGSRGRRSGSGEMLTSPSSLRLNFSSTSLDNRLNLSSPPHLATHTEESISTPEARATYQFVQYEDIDSSQKVEFEKLLKKESGCGRSWIHKGLVVNAGFLIVMIIGVVLGEVYFPLEGVRGRGVALFNDTNCMNEMAGCFTVRIVRSIGIFGFLGGVTNWIAIEMLFRRIPLLFGTGVFAKKYKEIREQIKNMVVDTLFDPSALKHYFTERRRNLREIFQLENHFGGLLESDVTSKIIDDKIDSMLARPEGFILTMMGVSHSQLKVTLKQHISSFIEEISPIILDKISSSGLADGVGLQAEVERILEERTEDLTRAKIRQLMSLMIRKHLNWLIVWGNILGALVGTVAEVIAIVVARYSR